MLFLLSPGAQISDATIIHQAIKHEEKRIRENKRLEKQVMQRGILDPRTRSRSFSGLGSSAFAEPSPYLYGSSPFPHFEGNSSSRFAGALGNYVEGWDHRSASERSRAEYQLAEARMRRHALEAEVARRVSRSLRGPERRRADRRPDPCSNFRLQCCTVGARGSTSGHHRFARLVHPSSDTMVAGKPCECQRWEIFVARVLLDPSLTHTGAYRLPFSTERGVRTPTAIILRPNVSLTFSIRREAGDSADCLRVWRLLHPSMTMRHTMVRLTLRVSCLRSILAPSNTVRVVS